MGPIKAALESVVRYLASELGPQRICVHAISSGPVATRAASGLKEFDQLLEEAKARSPVGELMDIDDVGATAAFLASRKARRYNLLDPQARSVGFCRGSSAFRGTAQSGSIRPFTSHRAPAL
jgi:NAD(P)-dependent dehydrogenase (short-subunit alcohol dehydrogenase family)